MGPQAEPGFEERWAPLKERSGSSPNGKPSEKAYGVG